MTMYNSDPLSLILLAVVQGFGEVLPISSTAHIVLVSRVIGFPSPSLREIVFLHLGSLCAIVIWFYRPLIDLAKQGWHFVVCYIRKLCHRNETAEPPSLTSHVPIMILLGLVPTAIVGLLLRQPVGALLDDENLIPFFLVANGGFIFIASRTRGEKRLENLGVVDFVLIGLAQGLAVIPGISRLGVTIGVALLRGLNWYDALKLSFVYAIPAILGSNIIFADFSAILKPSSSMELFSLLASFLLVFALTLGALTWLQSNMLERKKLTFWGWYCLSVGSFTLIYFATLGS